MGCQTSRLSGSFDAIHITHNQGRPQPLPNFIPHHHYPHSQQPPQYGRPESPSVYSSSTRSTPSHSRNNSQEQPLVAVAGYKQSSSGVSRFPDTSSNEKAKLTSSPSLQSRRTILKGIRSITGSNQKTPHFVFQTEKPLPSVNPEVFMKHPTLTIGPCGHYREQGSPCFACLREKPKPRRHRSRRNAQVMIPRTSFMGKRLRSSRLNANPEMEPLREEDLPPWVTNRHSVFISGKPQMSSVANQPLVPNSRYEPQGKGTNASLGVERPMGQSDITNRSVDAYPDSIVGGYIIPSEVYYASLPLPALPTEAGSVLDAKHRKMPVWI